MPDTFQEQLVQARRDLILEAATAVIAEQGFQRTTIRQIAAQAGVADGTIYNYFQNKDAILLGIVERLAAAELRELHFSEARHIDTEQFVRRYVPYRLQEIEGNLAALKVVVSETVVNADLGRLVNERIYGPSFAVAERYFQQLMDQGEMETADPAMMARLFAAPVLGLLLLRLLGDEHVESHWQQYANALVSFLLSAQGIIPSETAVRPPQGAADDN